MSNKRRIAILGREHRLAIVELEALYGPGSIEPIGNYACWVDVDDIDFERLGSSVKLLSHLETVGSKDLDTAFSAAEQQIRKLTNPKGGKLKLGVSVFGTGVSSKILARQMLGLKKSLRGDGYSVRIVPNKTQTLNAAQILRNKLTRENGFELNLVVDGGKIHIARTTEVQDIDEYARRDREKPVRDPLVGMLPPKLAQTLINLSTGQPGETLLDPFCGTGTVLMEAHQMGLSIYGSDLSDDMVSASKKNLEWLGASSDSVEHGDATSHQWKKQIDLVSAETYLGPPLHSIPEHTKFREIVEQVDKTHRDFLENLAAQIKSGTRVTLAVPAWRKNDNFIDLPVLDDLESLGYNPLSFEHIRGQLAYHRPNQVVARRILILKRK